MIMKKRDNMSLSSNLEVGGQDGTQQEVKEAWGSPGVENPSFNTTDISLTPIHSFTDDLGYQGSQDLTSEEDPSLVPGKRQKRNKIAIFRMRRNKVREEDENDKEDEEDKAGRSPRVRRKQHAYSKTRQPKQKENSGISESNLNTTVSNTKSSPWSMMEFRQYLCMCCRTKQKLVEENKASDSKERRNPDEKENGVTGSINEQARQQAPEGTPGEVPGKSQENRECNPSTCK
ncbi:uncharacterized protein [Bos indicus]|uniref:Uncharacterized protein n=1 Tax=Bos indicus TaxID=9915 RepID=A0ABM4RMG2_BOSIN|nr:uncharacterized protein LOC112445859 [Bos taurus]DAA31837.1 TPA: hypothetical protein BOS_2850 [Bos taurus]